MSFLKVFCPFCRTQLRRIEVSDTALSRRVQVTCFHCGKSFSYVPGKGKISYNKGRFKNRLPGSQGGAPE